MAFLTGTAGFVFRRSLMRRSSESGISTAAATASGDQKPLAGNCEIVQLFVGVLVVNYGANWRFQLDRLPLVARAIAALAVAAPLGFVLRVETKMEEGVLVRTGDQIDITAASAVTTTGTTARNKLLPPEGQTAVASLASLDANPDFVDEHGAGSVP